MADSIAQEHADHKPRELRRATFTEAAIRYHLISATIGIAIPSVLLGILLAIPTFGIGLVICLIPLITWPILRWYYTRYFAKLECVLTERKLHVGKGLLFRVEKAIPLDKITDMSMSQGPLLRYMKLEAMGVETAGQSGSGGGALVKLVGIENSRDFREAVIDQRDRVVVAADSRDRSHDAHEFTAPAAATGAGESVELLRDIRDALTRIEDRLPRG